MPGGSSWRSVSSARLWSRWQVCPQSERAEARLSADGCVCASRWYFSRNSSGGELSCYNEFIVKVSFFNLFFSFGINCAAVGVVSQSDSYIPVLSGEAHKICREA